MGNDQIFSTALEARFTKDVIATWQTRCRPRVLIVTDTFLSFKTDGFGLSRFLAAITLAPGIVKPILTLAHRSSHIPSLVTVGTDNYTVLQSFNFATAAAAVTLANYDQIWIFGAGAGGFALSNAEVAKLATFMNGGGGVFATGDHASLGRELCGSLPRIRHMREWRDAGSGGVPMGTEALAATAVNRIDTIVDFGANGLSDFDDQSDGVAQRIFPNYKVVDNDGGTGSSWTASVHPVIMLPGAAATRTNTNAGFKFDLDVLPDHPHESECYAVTSLATLNLTYNLSGQNFTEYQPSAATPGVKIAPEILAFSVSGGRPVLNGFWKPPVRPRMFGAIGAYDGRLAQPYPGNTQKPGRIVVDATWHHFVNVNIDGTGNGSGHTGLGTGTGAGFVPSASLQKIFGYFRNVVTWLQPENRIWCNLYWQAADVRFNVALYEELLDIDRLTGWRDLVGLGRDARRIAPLQSAGMLRDQIESLLIANERFRALSEMLTRGNGIVVDADVEAEHGLADAASDVLSRDELIDGIYGSVVAQLVRLLPDKGDHEATAAAVGAGPSPYVDRLEDAIANAIKVCVDHQRRRFERGLAQVDILSSVG